MSESISTQEKPTASRDEIIAKNAQLSEENSRLKNQLAWFKRQLFGQKSEKHQAIQNPLQHSIAELLQDLPELPAPAEVNQLPSSSRGKAPKKTNKETPDDSGLRFDTSVPVKEVTLTPPELSGDDADGYVVIGNKVTYRLAQRPSSHFVIKYTRPVLKKKSTLAITTTKAPDNVLDKSFADVSLLAGMLVDKFVYHMPLYRQHQRLQHSGIHIARSTLTNLTQKAITLLFPIYDAQFDNAMLSKVLAMDETPIKAGRKQKGKMQQAYFWPIYGDQDEVCFTFSKSRGKQHVIDQLRGFSGTLLTDGYGAYQSFCKRNEAITHAECWAHTRRYFEKAKEMEPAAFATAQAYIARIYKTEEAIREKALEGQKKADYRSKYSKPVVEAFFNWCKESCHRMDLVSTNPLSKALKYALNREASLQVFLSDPDVPVDTNHLERSIRNIAMGRKNWLFCWTEIGAEHAGVIQSLLTTCKLHDVNPYTWLVDVLQRISTHPASRVDELTPRRWKELFSKSPMTSHLNDL